MGDFIIEPILPAGKVHLFSGSSGAGKSTLLHQLCDKLRRGGNVAGYEIARPQRICYVGGDGDTETYRQLEDDLEITPLDHVNLIDEAIKQDMSAEAIHLRWLWEGYMKGRGYNIVVFDPTDLLVGISNFNDKREVATGFFRLIKWIKEHDLTAICVFHNNKTKKNDDFLDPFNRIGGSHSIQAYSNTKAVLFNENESEDGYPTLMLRGKRFAETKILLRRGEQGAFEIVSNADKLADEFLILGIFGDNEILDSGTVVQRMESLAGFKRATIFRHLKEAVSKGYIDKLEHGKYRRALINFN